MEDNVVSLFQGKYKLYDDGTLVSSRTGKEVTSVLSKKRNGTLYKIVRVYPFQKGGDRAYYPVHVLVAENFVPNPNNYPDVRPKDGDYLNTKAANLYWDKIDNPHLKKKYLPKCKRCGTVLSADEGYCIKCSRILHVESCINKGALVIDELDPLAKQALKHFVSGESKQDLAMRYNRTVSSMTNLFGGKLSTSSLNRFAKNQTQPSRKKRVCPSCGKVMSRKYENKICSNCLRIEKRRTELGNIIPELIENEDLRNLVSDYLNGDRMSDICARYELTRQCVHYRVRSAAKKCQQKG